MVRAFFSCQSIPQLSEHSLAISCHLSIVHLQTVSNVHKSPSAFCGENINN